MSTEQLRLETSLEQVALPLPGQLLLESFKAEMLKEKVFQTMFGPGGERIFIHKMPSLNQTILPLILMAWKSEVFNSSDVYFEGQVSMVIVLPVKLSGNYNALRRVGNMVQRFMGGTMDLFQGSTNFVPGLIKFGYGSEYNYDGLAAFDGLTCPVINVTLPFTFDLQLMQIQLPGFDLMGPLDQGDLGFVQEYLLEILKDDDTTVLVPEGILSENS